MKERTITLTLTPSEDRQTIAYTVWVDARPQATGTLHMEGAMFLHLETEVKNTLQRVCQQIHNAAKMRTP